MKILIVEDEQRTAGYLLQGLTENGFTVDVAGQGDDGLHQARTGQYDLVILDVMLPQRDGRIARRRVRVSFPLHRAGRFVRVRPPLV